MLVRKLQKKKNLSSVATVIPVTLAVLNIFCSAGETVMASYEVLGPAARAAS